MLLSRDTFYELLREWEDKHLTPGWSVVENQGNKIRQLIGYRTDLVSHLHFARLFLSQLLHVSVMEISWRKLVTDLLSHKNVVYTGELLPVVLVIA